MSLLSSSTLSSPATKGRAYRFTIRLLPEHVEGGIDGIGNWKPDSPPSYLQCMYACGSPARRDDTPGADGLLHTVYFFRGYAEFKNQVTIPQMQAWLGSRAAVVPVMIKDRDRFIAESLDKKLKVSGDDLLSKGWEEKKSWEEGSQSRKTKQGERNDVYEIRDILREHGPIQGSKIVADKFPGYFMRYASGLERLADILQPTPKDSAFVPRVWQEALLEILKGPAHDRWIFWVCDERGGMGKSRMATHLCCEMNAIELAGRSQDIAYAYNSQPIALFDCARAVKLELCTDLFECAEKLKDGRIFSAKYMSKTKAFKPPHVVFFSNARAPPGVWSADRLQEIVLASGVAFSPVSLPIPDIGGTEEESGVAIYNRLAKKIVERKQKELAEKRSREDDVEVEDM